MAGLSKTANIHQRRTALMLEWYDANRRELPWRTGPGEIGDPYHIWLSEIMLQQTLVATVIPYFRNFITQWPDIHSLARAPLDDVLTQWAGLGYYARARNLHKCADKVASLYNGVFPDEPAELQKLPGIGPYTAAAIAAIAFNKPVMPVDGNIERVVARLEAIKTPLPLAKREVHEVAQELVSPTRPGDIAQAVMDLGASLCAPKRALCAACPLNGECRAYAEGVHDDLPVKAAKASRPTRLGTIYWVENDQGEVLVRTRSPSGLLGGMKEFPSTPWLETGDVGSVIAAIPEIEDKNSPEPQPIDGRVHHVFSHFALELEPKYLRLNKQPDLGPQYLWVHPRNFAKYALPSVMRKVAAHVLERLQESQLA